MCSGCPWNKTKNPGLGRFGAFFKLLILTDIFLPKLTSIYALLLVVRIEHWFLRCYPYKDFVVIKSCGCLHFAILRWSQLKLILFYLTVNGICFFWQLHGIWGEGVRKHPPSTPEISKTTKWLWNFYQMFVPIWRHIIKKIFLLSGL